MFGYEAVLVQGLFKIALALIGIITCRLTLIWFDCWLKDTSFTEWLRGATDEAKSMYYAGRFIAVAIIVGCAIN